MNHIKAAFPAGRPVPASGLIAVNRDHLWDTFHKLKEARKHFRLSSGAIHTLCALLSFLKDGGQPIVFASNRSIQKRAVLDEDRTLRRHIASLIEAGFLTRQDSSNLKRYKTTDPVTGEAQAFGFDVSPFLARSNEITRAAEEIEAANKRCKHLRKTLLALLAILQVDHASFVEAFRKELRRKMTVADYLAAIDRVEGMLPKIAATLGVRDVAPAAGELPEVNDEDPTERSGCDGQNVRHQSKSEKDNLDLNREPKKIDDEQLMQMAVETCREGMAFATEPIRTLGDMERLAYQLAPMMGIDRTCYNQACAEQPSQRVALSTLLILQMGTRIRSVPAYFRSVMLGKRAASFNPLDLLLRLSGSREGVSAA